VKETFVDEAVITVYSGAGGDGCVSFRREKFVPMGGPDGGDGGRGGDVVLVADRGQSTLLGLRHRRKFRAPSGAPGAGARKTGAAGASVEIRVPVGTLVRDNAHGDEGPILADLAEHGARFVAARGGRGGHGNVRFKTATRQTPDFAKAGTEGESRELRLSLKLLADVGLLGLPNAGKSTLLGRISAARPKVAAYPFTTLVPSLGVVEVDEDRFVVADIPGLIEGASEGVGLGDRFLRHVERTRVLVHLIDVGSLLVEHESDASLLESYEVIRREISSYQPALAERTELVALNKVDLAQDRHRLDLFEKTLRDKGARVFRISAATGEGLPDLLRAVAHHLEEARAEDLS